MAQWIEESVVQASLEYGVLKGSLTQKEHAGPLNGSPTDAPAFGIWSNTQIYGLAQHTSASVI